ncbi:MAG: hypothetical protein QXS20_01225 [Candidatus Thorarchaeota archaeon]
MHLLFFLERYGTLGAKPQLGYGRFKILNRSELLLKVTKIDPSQNQKQPSGMSLIQSAFFTVEFSESPFTQLLKNIVSSKLTLERLKEQNLAPISPMVKDYLRFIVGAKWSTQEELDILGGQDGNRNRYRSKISASWAYRTEGKWRIDVFAGPCAQQTGIGWNSALQVLRSKNGWQDILGLANPPSSVQEHSVNSRNDLQTMLEEVIKK